MRLKDFAFSVAYYSRKLKMYEEQELTMQVMSEFDASQVNVPPNTSQGPSVTVDAEWSPERRTSIDLSQVFQFISLSYSTNLGGYSSLLSQITCFQF